MINSLDIHYASTIDQNLEYYIICEDELEHRISDISYFCRLEEEHYPLLF